MSTDPADISRDEHEHYESIADNGVSFWEVGSFACNSCMIGFEVTLTTCVDNKLVRYCPFCGKQEVTRR